MQFNTHKTIIAALLLLAPLLSSAQMMQIKGLEFYDQSGDWTMLDKVSGSTFVSTKTSENGTDGKIFVDVYKSSKVESDEAILKDAFNNHVSSEAWGSQQSRSLTNSELQGTEGLDITAYTYSRSGDDPRVWTEVWLVHHADDGRTYVFTAVCTNEGAGISEPLKEDLKMMLGTIRVIQK